MVYVLLSLILLSFSEDTKAKSPQPKTNDNRHKVTNISVISDNAQIREDIELLGMTKKSYAIVTGKTITSKEKRAEEALKTAKTSLIFLKLATEEELNILFQGLDKDLQVEGSQVGFSPILFTILGRITILLGGFNSLELLNIVVRPGANSKESCMALRESINSISHQRDQEKAWALVRFFPSVLDAINNHYQFTGAINLCEWNKL